MAWCHGADVLLAHRLRRDLIYEREHHLSSEWSVCALAILIRLTRLISVSDKQKFFDQAFAAPPLPLS